MVWMGVSVSCQQLVSHQKYQELIAIQLQGIKDGSRLATHLKNKF